MSMSGASLSWIFLLIAGSLEVASTTMFRYTGGLSRPLPTIAFFTLGIASFYFLYRSLSAIPLGTAYAVWTGIGAAGTALIGMAVYAEPVTTARLVFLTLLIGSIVGLKFVSSG